MRKLILRKIFANDSNEPFVPDAKFKHPDVAPELFAAAQKDAEDRLASYQRLAQD